MTPAMPDESANLPLENQAPRSVYMTRASMFQQLRQTDARERQAAWTAFRDRYAPIIAGFARKCGASSQDLDDIVQDVMTAFVGVHGEFNYDPSRGRFRGWLKTCTVRAAIRRAGKNLRFRGVPLDEVADAEIAVEPLWEDVWEEHLVKTALAQLREELGDSSAFRAFEQYALRDRDAAEVAAEMGLSLDSVHQAKTRMTRRLRERIQELRQAEA